MTIATVHHKEFEMGTLRSKVPELLRKHNLKPMDLIRMGIPYSAAYRAARGDTNFTTKSLVQLCDVLGVESLDDLFVYEREQDGA